MADHLGPLRVMITSDAVMLLATAGLAIAVWVAGTPPWLLIVIAGLVGVADAFYTPASGVMPRLLVPGPSLGRAMAARQSVGQIANAVGPAAGGAVAATWGLAAAAGLNAASFTLILLTLWALRRRLRGPSSDSHEAPRFIRQALDGLRICARDPLLRSLLMLTLAAAAVLLPVTSVLTPLLVRAHGWSAVSAGQIVGLQASGAGVVAVVVMLRGCLPRPGVVSALGLACAGIATCGMAVAPDFWVVAGAAFVAGVSVGTFGTHLGPLVLASAPASHVARVQAVLVLVQTLPLPVTLNLLGRAADHLGPQVAILFCGVVSAITGVGAASLASIRTARIPT